jgi:hypothetical protein
MKVIVDRYEVEQAVMDFYSKKLGLKLNYIEFRSYENDLIFLGKGILQCIEKEEENENQPV